MLPAVVTAEPISATLALLALLWLVAKLGGEGALRLHFPAVAGELAAGIALGALARRFPWFPPVAADPQLELLGNLGIVVLMFAVGLESTVPQMVRVGWSAVRVAVLGVVAPMAAGLLAAFLLLPRGTPVLADLFVGACLCATSIGISAQVLQQFGAAKSREGRIIVGAAVIDDVLGLLVLGGISGAVTAVAGGSMAWGRLTLSLVMALGFLAAALSLGRRATPHLFRLATRFRSHQVLLPLALAFAFLLAWLGHLAGLAAIVGAYAAGLILEPAHIQILEERELCRLEQLVQPLVVVLSPLFFVLMGARVDPATLLEPRILGFTLALAALGIAGKLAAGFIAGNGSRWDVVGWGMVPRGEVGLIFVAAGSQLRLDGQPLLSGPIQTGIVGALLLTTIAGPLGLGRALRRGAARQP
ncbi:MAG: cation:proton antiporter [Holophaga sp.]|nr:cation:proton antiporter [Holophaga sp.]